MTGDPTCAHRILTNDFVITSGKAKRIGYCKKRKIRMTWRYNCSSSCSDYTPKNPTKEEQTTLEGTEIV